MHKINKCETCKDNEYYKFYKEEHEIQQEAIQSLVKNVFARHKTVVINMDDYTGPKEKPKLAIWIPVSSIWRWLKNRKVKK